MQFQGTYYSWGQKENDICYVKLKQLKFAVNLHGDNYSDYFLLLYWISCYKIKAITKLYVLFLCMTVFNMKINAPLSIIIQAGMNEENGGNSFLNFTIQLCYHVFVSD